MGVGGWGVGFEVGLGVDLVFGLGLALLARDGLLRVDLRDEIINSC